MTSADEFEQERLELAKLMGSGTFSRAPHLALILNYVCAKYFEHRAGQIKEYNIAVEALGRPAEFDPRADSIVRVEAHRLRKRLKEYYEEEGAGHGVHIEIPPGQYAPRFLVLKPQSPETAIVEVPLPGAAVESPESGSVAVLSSTGKKWPLRAAKLWVALAALVLLGAAY